MATAKTEKKSASKKSGKLTHKAFVDKVSKPFRDKRKAAKKKQVKRASLLSKRPKK